MKIVKKQKTKKGKRNYKKRTKKNNRKLKGGSNVLNNKCSWNNALMCITCKQCNQQIPLNNGDANVMFINELPHTINCKYNKYKYKPKHEPTILNLSPNLSSNPNYTEVFRIIKFDPNKCYNTALETIKQDKKYYAETKDLEYLGWWDKTERFGMGEGGTQIHHFIDADNNKRQIELDYDGNTCFIEVECRGSRPSLPT